MLTKSIDRSKQKSPIQQNKKNSMKMLFQYCKNISEWHESWEGVTADLKIGLDIVEQFKPFLIDRIDKGRSKRTIKIYANYLWSLGGELIRELNENESKRKLSARELILKYIDDSGGPYWRHARDEMEHRKYDSVCKQLFRFMSENPN